MEVRNKTGINCQKKHYVGTNDFHHTDFRVTRRDSLMVFKSIRQHKFHPIAT
jgi:hypothetical protein